MLAELKQQVTLTNQQNATDWYHKEILEALSSTVIFIINKDNLHELIIVTVRVKVKVTCIEDTC